jgi:uncharacterized membrane protein YgcG
VRGVGRLSEFAATLYAVKTPRDNVTHTHRLQEAGYALVALMIMVTVILISLTEALPDIDQNVRREREKEVIFRGEQYARAIYIFHRTLGRYPNSVKELLDTNGTRFLRQAYPDPLSPNGRWHFIHASASGIILDSQNQTVTPTSQPGGTSSPPGSQGQPNGNTSAFGSSQTNSSSSAFGSSAQANSSSSAFGSSGQTNSSSSGFGSGTGFSSSSGSGSSTQTGQASTANGTKKKAPTKVAADCNASDDSGFSSAQTGQLLGATIVGVAPCNLKASIQVLDKKDHYYQWEFLGMNYVPYQLPQVQAVKPSSSFGNSQPGQAQPLGSSPNSASPGTQNNSPQSNQTQSPF